MPKKTPDYDNVFKTMKTRYKRMFIPIINDIFGKNYPLDAAVEVLPSEGYLTGPEQADGSRQIEEQISDFLIRIGGDTYLLECQSYDDGSMAIRVAEYAFIAARQSATWDIGHAVIPMPWFSIIYIKRTARTPRETRITFTFPNGQSVDYTSPNVIVEELTKEYIIEKRLLPYIPFYITRYEAQMIRGDGEGLKEAASDLEYLRDGMLRLHREGWLANNELVDLASFVNTVITHITDGNNNEERLVNIMGGTVIETASEKLIRQGIDIGRVQGIDIGKAQGIDIGKAQGIDIGKAQMLIKIGQEQGLDYPAILTSIQDKMGLSLSQATVYLEQYGNKAEQGFNT